MVVPALTALLADAAVEGRSDLGPFLGALLLDEHQDHAVFVFGPGAFHQTGVQHLLPPVQALHVSAARQILSNLLPVLLVIASDSICQHQVFELGPVALGRPILIFGRSNFI